MFWNNNDPSITVQEADYGINVGSRSDNRYYHYADPSKVVGNRYISLGGESTQTTVSGILSSAVRGIDDAEDMRIWRGSLR